MILSDKINLSPKLTNNLVDYNKQSFHDKTKAKEYFEKLEGQTIPPFKINIKIHNLLQSFIISGGFEV